MPPRLPVAPVADTANALAAVATCCLKAASRSTDARTDAGSSAMVQFSSASPVLAMVSVCCVVVLGACVAERLSGLTSMLGGASGVSALISTHQPPLMLPLSPAASSTTYRLQVPLGSVPLKTASWVAAEGAGAGAGKVSPVPKFVGLYVPEVISVESGSVEAAASSNTRSTFTMALLPPASDMMIRFWPAGPTSRMSMSSGKVWFMPYSLTLTSVSDSGRPETTMLDG